MCSSRFSLAIGNRNGNRGVERCAMKQLSMDYPVASQDDQQEPSYLSFASFTFHDFKLRVPAAFTTV